MSAISGTIQFKVDGEEFDVVGEFKFGLGKETREGLVGHNRVHGFKTLPTVPFIEGEVRDSKDVSLDKMSKITDSTITLSLANGKIYSFKNSWNCNTDGLGLSTENGNIPVRFEAMSAQEIR